MVITIIVEVVVKTCKFLTYSLHSDFVGQLFIIMKRVNAVRWERERERERESKEKRRRRGGR